MRRSALLGAATGVALGGAAIGLAVERFLIGRSRKPDPALDIALGSVHGEPAVVRADDGVELYAEVDQPPGVATGPTLVFVHGYALNLDCWHFQRRALAGGFGPHRAVLYDQRSHGRSGRSPRERCTIEQLGSDLVRVIDELAGDGPLVLIGHSMGGMSILAAAGEHQDLFADRVVGVGLLATSAGDMRDMTFGAPGPVGRLVHRTIPSFVAALSRAPDLVENGRKAGSDVGYLLTRRYSFASKVPAARVEFVAEMLAATPIEVVADFFPTIATYDQNAAVSMLERVETLIIGGRDDLIVPVAHSRRLADRLPLAAYVELDDCGHMVPLEYPDLVNEHLATLVGQAAEAA